MLVGLVFEFFGVVKFDQVDGFLDVVELFLMGHPDLLVASAELVDPFDFVGVVFEFLGGDRGTYWLILLT